MLRRCRFRDGAFLDEIREKSSLQRLGLRTLESESGNVKRDAWDL